jgi:KTSC domain
MVPKMRPVDSTSVAAIGYDESTRRVFVRFCGSTRLYAYSGVPARVFEDLERADSTGRFVNTVIKPRYAVRKL